MTIDITEEDIARLVPAFYARIRQDPELGPVFNRAIENWPQHIERLKAFWSSVMLTTGRYKGQPMIAHIRHEQDMTPANFARWLELWKETCGDLLPTAASSAFQNRAGRIAESIQSGINSHRSRSALPTGIHDLAGTNI